MAILIAKVMFRAENNCVRTVDDATFTNELLREGAGKVIDV